MRIGLWNTAFLGDAVLTLPLVQALRTAFPNSRLDWYVRRGVGPLFAALPGVQVHELGRDERSAAGMFRLTRAVAAQKYDVWISAHLSARSSLVARASCAPVRIGYDGAWHRALAYTHCVARRFGELDEIERLLELLRPLSPPCAGLAPPWPPGGMTAWPPEWSSVWPDLQAVWSAALPAQVRAAAAAFRVSLPAGPLLGLHPGSVWATKRWMPEGFAFVARQAIDAGAVVALFAAQDEAEQVQRVLSLAGLDDAHPRVRNLAGQLDIAELAARLALLDCYLTNDSGPMHIAWMLGTPVVALFGPTTRSLGFFPRGERNAVMEPPALAGLDCRPCGLHGPQVCPRGDHACMAAMTPERVWDAVAVRLWHEAVQR